MNLDHGLLDRFVDKILVTETCWLWTGAHGQKGYGNIRETGPSRNTRPAHRVSYEFFVGPIPAGLEIDHLCRNPSCVNPDHLEAVTRRENVLRGVSLPAARARRTHCPQGHAYDDANTYVYGRERHCRRCRADREMRRYYARLEREAVVVTDR